VRGDIKRETQEGEVLLVDGDWKSVYGKFLKGKGIERKYQGGGEDHKIKFTKHRCRINLLIHSLRKRDNKERSTKLRKGRMRKRRFEKSR